MKYTLDIPAIVYRDIGGICDFIAADKPSAAKKVAARLFRAISRLADLPLAHGELNKKFDVETDLRVAFEKPYVILFKVSGSIVQVYRVLDGRSNYLVRLGLQEPTEDTDDD
jgi:plasmid stabilization system protein ParE